MADIFDSDSDSDASFHGFSHEEIEEAFGRNNARVDRDESLDLSVEEYSSSEDESETESSSEDTDNDQAVRPDVEHRTESYLCTSVQRNPWTKACVRGKQERGRFFQYRI